jgi:hypothetical protein
MIWQLSHRADRDALPIADRHYNRQKPGTPQFVPPGRCVVLLADTALWVTSWPLAEFVKHRWAGAWVNSCFRREDGPLASTLIRDAVAVTRYVWAGIPELGMVSFIDPSKVAPRKIHGRSTWGHCYFEAGFFHDGYTKDGLWAMRLRPEDMPEPQAPFTTQRDLIFTN